MKTSVRRWGNSLAIRIPRAFANEILLEEGSAVDLQVKSGNLMIRPAPRNRAKLHSLLAQIRESNQHSETDWGLRKGHEIW
jgi:antitoxin MazE